jgi:hypothetical protein
MPWWDWKIGSGKRALEIFRAPAVAAQRQQRQLSEREARVLSLQRSETLQGRKMSSARRDHDFPRASGLLLSMKDSLGVTNDRYLLG